jgi:diadenosine tetraphosphate (Ap4A) HIT family hydrolase
MPIKSPDRKSTPYDSSNIFAQILKGKIPSTPVDEDDNTLSIADINPQAPIHHLVLPKGAYADLTSFADEASDKELADWLRAVVRVARQADLTATGYRVIINCGRDGHQEVPHLHGHVIGGRPLGSMIRRQD